MPKTLGDLATAFLMGGALAAAAVLADSLEQEVKAQTTKKRKPTGKIIEALEYEVRKGE